MGVEKVRARLESSRCLRRETGALSLGEVKGAEKLQWVRVPVLRPVVINTLLLPRLLRPGSPGLQSCSSCSGRAEAPAHEIASKSCSTSSGWRTPLIPGPRRQRQANL